MTLEVQTNTQAAARAHSVAPEVAHGLDGSLVAPDWPALTLSEVQAVLRHFPEAGAAQRLLSVSPRPFSAASVVATGTDRVFVKRHARAVRDAAGLAEEHRFMAHLRDHSAPVPRVYAAASGATAIETGEWTYEVHAIPPGIDLYEDALSWTPFRSTDHAWSAGAMLARLHLAAAGYGAPPRTGRALTAGFSIFAARDPKRALARYVAHRPALHHYLADRTCSEEALSLLAPFHAELQPLLRSLAPLWTHNDLHPSNLLWSDTSQTARATAAIDFGLADRTHAVHDIAQAIERSIIEWLALVNDPEHPEDAPVHLDHLVALLDGYTSVRTLSPDEAVALAPMLAVCHAEFALSETDYFLSVLHAPDKACLGCEGYLVAHARWFRGAGTNLLNAIRTWAAQQDSRAPRSGAARP
jgi:Ser/Thr protein kinase RdoA (MazF antagonist)